MTFELDAPSRELIECFDDLEAMVATDTSGDMTRRLVIYLGAAELQSRAWQLKVIDFEERQFAGNVSEAFSATRRILLLQWQKKHEQELHL